jgi:hypothetical protein
VKALYSASTNTLTELSEIEKPLPLPPAKDYDGHPSDYNRDLYNHACNMEIYNAHIASLRTVPLAERSEHEWKDGGILEQGKDYEVKQRFLGESAGEYFAYPLSQPVPEDELWNEVLTDLAYIESDYQNDCHRVSHKYARDNRAKEWEKIKQKYSIAKKQ